MILNTGDAVLHSEIEFDKSMRMPDKNSMLFNESMLSPIEPNQNQQQSESRFDGLLSMSDLK